MVANLGNIKGIAAAGAYACDDGLELVVGNNFFDTL